MASRHKNKRAQRRAAQRHAPQRTTPAIFGSQVVPSGPLDLRPKPAPNESPEDVAVFAKTSRDQLPPNLRDEASGVSDALDLVHHGRFDEAADRLKAISRGSPYADWRLFIRGLIALYGGDQGAARENWSRLDRARRPARIAATLWAAETNSTLDENPPPPKLVEAARELTHRPAMIAAARRIAAVTHRDEDTVFSPRQVDMLREFRQRFRLADHDFDERFSQACVVLAYFQPHAYVFHLLKSAVPGPALDPNWNRLGFVYATLFMDAEEDIERYANAFLTVDLPRLQGLTEEVKKALASTICLIQARRAVEIARENRSSFWFDPSPVNYDAVKKRLREAIKWYPRNRVAHSELVNLIEDQLNREDRPAMEERLHRELVHAQQAFVEEFPGEVQRVLWLIDEYFDEDDLGRVETLVRKLQDQRLEDPRAKALPWKLKIREAMRLSRKKSETQQARGALDAAEALWPTWLRLDWLPFLRAALALRAGDLESFERLNDVARRGCGDSQFLGEAMMFAALQVMKLPAPGLKPFRDAMDRYVKSANEIPLKDLVVVGSFFWDLIRTGLLYPAYRLQVKRLGQAFCAQMKAVATPPVDGLLVDACCWVAHHRFWSTAYSDKEPGWAKTLARSEPKFAWAILKIYAEDQYGGYAIAKRLDLVNLVEQAKGSEGDPYYRFVFAETCGECRAKVADFEARTSRNASFSFNSGFDDGNDDGNAGECNCPACRAKRARAGGDRNAPTSQFESDEYDDEYYDDDEDIEDDDQDDVEDDVEDEFDDEPNMDIPPGVDMPLVARILAKLGPNGVKELDALQSELGPDVDVMVAVRRLVDVLRRYGISADDGLRFVEQIRQSATDSDFAESPQPQRQPVPKPPELTPEELEAWRAKRKKILKRAKQSRKF